MAECGRCGGCKQIADSEDGEAWSHWESLPPGADVAVKAGIVKPIPCPACKGTGEEPAKILSLEGEKRKRVEANESPQAKHVRELMRVAADEQAKINAESAAQISPDVGMATPAYDPDFNMRCSRWQWRQNSRTLYASRALGLFESSLHKIGGEEAKRIAAACFAVAEEMLAEDERRQEPFPTSSPGEKPSSP